jgi:hypothetical protein
MALCLCARLLLCDWQVCVPSVPPSAAAFRQTVCAASLRRKFVSASEMERRKVETTELELQRLRMQALDHNNLVRLPAERARMYVRYHLPHRRTRLRRIFGLLSALAPP